MLISPWICKTLHLEAIYRFTRTHPFPTPDGLSRTLSLHSVLVEGTQRVGKVPSQCQRQSVQHDKRCEWIEQDHCIFQKWQSWKRDRARADRCTHWTRGAANLQRSMVTLAELWLHSISHCCLSRRPRCHLPASACMAMELSQHAITMQFHTHRIALGTKSLLAICVFPLQKAA